jgi:hypothetical protein
MITRRFLLQSAAAAAAYSSQGFGPFGPPILQARSRR